MDWSYLIQAGKEGFRERIWTHVDASQASPTVGTAMNANPTIYASHEAMVIINNKASRTGDGKNVFVIPVSITLITTVRGTAGTAAVIGLAMDATTAYASGGGTLAARYGFVDTRSGWSARTAYASINFGDLVPATTTKYVFLGWYPWAFGSTPFAVGDTFRWNFGGSAGGTMGHNIGIDTNAADPQVRDIPLPPLAIAPGCSLLIHPFVTAMSAAASFTCQVTTIELGHPREVA